MKKLIVIAFLCVTLMGSAQQTRRIRTHAAANPADDRRPNSAMIPSVEVFRAQIQHVVILRFKYSTDLLAGLQQAIKDQGIRNAVILSGFGSVRNYQVHTVANRTLPPEDMLVKDPTASADIVSMSGMVMNGRVHPHITLANPKHAFGGHLEPDTNVFTFAVVTLGVLNDDLDLTKLDDWNER
ncbi:MAG: PPC domain-containing DNA-binding protein [Acidobacteriota bacterium]